MRCGIHNYRVSNWEGTAAYAGLSGDKAGSYEEVKTAILHHYNVNEETHCQRFHSDHKKAEEFYQNWVIASRITLLSGQRSG